VVVVVDDPLVPEEDPLVPEEDPLVALPGFPGCVMTVALLVRVVFQGCQMKTATSAATTTIATMAKIATELPPPSRTMTGSRMKSSFSEWRGTLRRRRYFPRGDAHLNAQIRSRCAGQTARLRLERTK